MEKENSVQKGAPRLGVFWYAESEWISIDIKLQDGKTYGDNVITPVDHFSQWEKLRGEKKVPDVEYEHYPRGRIKYNKPDRIWTVTADEDITGRAELREKILEIFCLPKEYTIFFTDEHYQNEVYEKPKIEIERELPDWARKSALLRRLLEGGGKK